MSPGTYPCSIQMFHFIYFIFYFYFREDVWFVTVTQALTWMTDPKPVKALNNYEAWRCDRNDLPAAPCNLPNKCALSFKQPESNFTDTRYMETCSECPNQ